MRLFIQISLKEIIKLAVKRKEDVEELFRVIDMLRQRIPLPQEKKDHPLSGKYSGYRECHVRPDFLLVYKIVENRLELILYRTGTHSDLF